VPGTASENMEFRRPVIPGEDLARLVDSGRMPCRCHGRTTWWDGSGCTLSPVLPRRPVRAEATVRRLLARVASTAMPWSGGRDVDSKPPLNAATQSRHSKTPPGRDRPARPGRGREEPAWRGQRTGSPVRPMANRTSTACTRTSSSCCTAHPHREPEPEPESKRARPNPRSHDRGTAAPPRQWSRTTRKSPPPPPFTGSWNNPMCPRKGYFRDQQKQRG
jgi:hypothetical protein